MTTTGGASDGSAEQRQQRGRAAMAAVAAVITMGLLTAVTAVVVTQGRLGPVDAWVLARFSPVPTSGLVHAVVQAYSLTAEAPVGLAVLGMAGIVAYVRTRSLLPLLMAWGAGAALVLCVYVGKLLVGRARPGIASITDPEPAFPSGHSTTAVVMLGVVVVLLSPWLRRGTVRLAWVLAVGYAAVIGIGRLYLGLHWFSDVLAGWLLGALIVSLCAWVMASGPSTAWHRAGSGDGLETPLAIR